MKDKEYLTRKEVADYLGKSIKTVYKYKYAGLIFNNLGMIKRKDFLKWVEGAKKVQYSS